MIIGEMRSRITFQEPQDVSDGMGGFTRSWVNVVTVWGQIEPAKPYEQNFAARIEENITHKVIIRYRTGLNAAMRISYKGRILQIKGIKEVENRHKFFIIDCDEGVAT